MQQIPLALKALESYDQFVLYRLINSKTLPGAMDKIPISPHTCEAFESGMNWQDDPAQWANASQACAVAHSMGASYGVGFLFTDADPFWFLDIDKCLVDGQWSHFAQRMMGLLSGCAVEVSQSGAGLHLFGTGVVPEHRCKNKEVKSEFYHQGRFVALTGHHALGDAGRDCSRILPAIVGEYFAPRTKGESMGWTNEPVEHYSSTETDEELIAKACESGGVNALFNRSGGVTFRDLWEGNEDKLAEKWPEGGNKLRSYAESEADLALANHLAWWTGGNCERIEGLMRQSALYRPKWDSHPTYLSNFTIETACAGRTDFYSVREPVATIPGVCDLRGSDKEVAWAEQLRATKLITATPEQLAALKDESDAQVWIKAQELSAAEMAARVTVVDNSHSLYCGEAVDIEGQQYITSQGQKDYFKGCVYVDSEHAIYTPSGMLNRDRFDMIYAGPEFEMGLKKKDTSTPWDAFKGNTEVRQARVKKTCFRPRVSAGAVITEGGDLMINTYKDIPVPSAPGDVSLFKKHLKKLLPDERDRTILVSFMAACVQHKGCKFQWAPFIQGVEGNGKSFLSFCVIAALGEEHTHMPLSNELGEKYNEWAFGKLFIGVEDVYVTQGKQVVMEIVKPMITSARLARRGMAKGQEMLDLCCNWMLNSNYQDGYRKTGNDRRISPFFTAQQHKDDLIRDGMTGPYFNALYEWARGEGGFANITHYLQNYEIAAEFNPAVQDGGLSGTAPVTTSTLQAIEAGRGGVEQEVLERIEQGVLGFRGGWISSIALDNMLIDIRRETSIPRNKRRLLLESLGYRYHPALTDGRSTRKLAVDDGGRPLLYVRDGHAALDSTSAKAAVDAYERAQQDASSDVINAQKVFGR